MVMRYNMYSAAVDHRQSAPGTGSAQAIELMQEIADKEHAERSMQSEWTELAYLQNQAGNTAMWFFALAVVFVFLVLAAQYESWKLPLGRDPGGADVSALLDRRRADRRASK